MAPPPPPVRDEAVEQLRVRGAIGPTTAGLVGALLSLLILAITGKTSPPGLAAYVAAVAAPIVLIALSWPSTLRVGNDGVWLGKPWRRVFVPAREIRAVHQRWNAPRRAPKDRSAPEIVLERRRGRGLVVVPMVGPSAERVAAVAERIRRVSRAAAAERTSAMGALERGGRTFEAWRRDLAGALRPGGFRTAGVDEDDLREVLEDPNALTEQRIGAALALASGDGGAADRIRVAAAASARPRLRIALETVAAGPEREASAEIEAALAEDAEIREATAASREAATER